MAVHFRNDEHAIIAAALERLIPADPITAAPGAAAIGAADYVDQLLGAFAFNPPHIWAGGPFSGRHGGTDGFSAFIPLRPLDELAWRTRIEGSQGIAEREFNGSVVGLQERYRDGLVALGPDFAMLVHDEQEDRLDEVPEFKSLLYEHACEATYGDPVYGGNRDGAGWRSISFAGDVQPGGWTDTEVAEP